MKECPQEIVEIVQGFDGRKVTAGHFTLGVAPSRVDNTGNSHACLKIVSVGGSVYYPMRPFINMLVFSAERQPNAKYKLWQYFRDQAPREPWSMGEYGTADELKAGLEQAVSFM